MPCPSQVVLSDSALEEVPACCEPIISTKEESPVTSEISTNSLRTSSDILPASNKFYLTEPDHLEVPIFLLHNKPPFAPNTLKTLILKRPSQIKQLIQPRNDPSRNWPSKVQTGHQNPRLRSRAGQLSHL